MAFGFGPGANMQRDYNRNRSQLARRKSLRDIHNENTPDHGDDSVPQYRQLSPEKLEQFKRSFREQANRDRRKSLILLAFFILLGVASLVLIFV